MNFDIKKLLSQPVFDKYDGRTMAAFEQFFYEIQGAPAGEIGAIYNRYMSKLKISEKDEQDIINAVAKQLNPVEKVKFFAVVRNL